MKYIGIDYGSKRVGVAISDADGLLAFPKEIIIEKEALIYILAIIKDTEIGGIVIGKSINSSGGFNTIMDRIHDFETKLMAHTRIPIYFEREDFSSYEAHRFQTEKGSRDDSAAAIILQRFLDKKSMRN
jgi:putative Holliday junction resolvase